MRNMDTAKALLRIQQYCAKAERCHSEVWQKLRDWELRHYEANEIIVTLIEHNFLNEQRYTNAFVHDKFYLQQWGRVKIVQHLKQKQISPICIDEAMQRIVETDYAETARQLALRKIAQLPSDLHPALKSQKVSNFLIQRGFELPLAWETARQSVQKRE
jgi:regulatory protein